MPKYEIEITEEIEDFLKQVAHSSNLDIPSLVQELLNQRLEGEKTGMVIKLYKEGKLKAREAWKLSGLTYQEFQERATN